MMSDQNLKTQKEHYDRTYNSISPEFIIEKVNSILNNFALTIATYSSYHALYYNDFSNQIINKNILEIGCGDGIKFVLATDIADTHIESIKKAVELMSINNIDIISGDLANMKLNDDIFDIVVGKGILHHLDHETEDRYLFKIAKVLKADGFARFEEPAVNSQLLESLRLIIPIKSRPSILRKKAYDKWKLTDVHPERDNSTKHYLSIGDKYFQKTDFIPFGSVDRLERLINNYLLKERFKRMSHRIEDHLPFVLRTYFSQFQLLNNFYPKKFIKR